MWHIMRIFLRSAVCLTATLVIAAALPVQAAPTQDNGGLLAGPQASQSGLPLLAQKADPEKEKQPSPAPLPKEQKKLKTMGVPPCPEMERMERGVGRDEPQKAGTKKLGGQTIRAKETPGGE